MYDDLVSSSSCAVGLIASSLVFSKTAIDVQSIHMFLKAMKGMRVCISLSGV